MKKILLALLGAITLASISSAQTNVVLSRNAVGYIRIELETNKLYLLSNPFVPLNPNDALLTNMLAVLPNNSSVIIWDEDTQAYINYGKSSRGIWSAGALTAKIARADAFFIDMPSSGSTTLYFMGEVPDRFTAPTTVQTRVSGITMLGYPYPVHTTFTSTPMALVAPNGTTFSVWDPTSQSYIDYAKSIRGTWNAAATSAVVIPGQGFAINTLAPATNFSTIKPYTWP